MKTLVLVDFDKTLYSKDSLIEFTRFYKRNYQFIIGFIALFPMLLNWKLSKISNETAKQKFMTYFFRNEHYNLFLEKGKQFADENIPRNLNKNIWGKIQKFQEQKADIYIVTASFREWIYGWTEEHNLQIISTELEIVNNKITGKFKTKNCYGIEKVNRINEKINLENYDKIVVFGNGKGDYEMLQLSK
jgi:phosphatidylglycerophosphatase C